jgi:hypothetical protein
MGVEEHRAAFGVLLDVWPRRRGQQPTRDTEAMVAVTLGNNRELTARILEAKIDSLRRRDVFERAEVVDRHLNHPSCPLERPMRLPRVYPCATTDELDKLDDVIDTVFWAVVQGSVRVNLLPGTYDVPPASTDALGKLASWRARSADQ